MALSVPIIEGWCREVEDTGDVLYTHPQLVLYHIVLNSGTGCVLVRQLVNQNSRQMHPYCSEVGSSPADCLPNLVKCVGTISTRLGIPPARVTASYIGVCMHCGHHQETATMGKHVCTNCGEEFDVMY